MPEEHLTLLCDVYAYAKPDIIWGRKGEKVIQVALYDQMVIVENSNGVQFPVHSKKLGREEFVAIEMKEPVQAKQISKPVPHKKVKAVPATQKNLF